MKFIALKTEDGKGSIGIWQTEIDRGNTNGLLKSCGKFAMKINATIHMDVCGCIRRYS